MAAVKEGASFDVLARDIRAGKFSAVYYLMGEEDYYIDRLSDMIVAEALKPDERDFNLTVFYGSDADAARVMDACRRYPMMAERQVVVVREAQAMSGTDALLPYIMAPNPQTVLVMCHKHGVLDGRRKFGQAVKKNCAVFESKRLWDNQLPTFVSNFLKEKKLGIEPQANLLLCESVGCDLSRLSKEIEKLALVLPEGVGVIDAAMVARNIGVSHEYNNLELVAALVAHDSVKAMRIVNYFSSNPKNFSLQATTSFLFAFFSNLMLAWYAPDRTEQGIANYIEQQPWYVRKNVIPAMKSYSARKVLQILRFLRVTDAKSKGVECPNTPPSELLMDLIYFILH